jgi:prevent-host-death family protein
MAKEINALELRKRFGEIMEEVRYRKEPYVVTRHGRPMIVLVDIEAYDAAEAQRREDAFIETYSDERVQEFLKDDRVSPRTRQHVKRLLE